jgi:predicted AlkP superfamily phosphohydrolase/phosphomutase
MSQLDDRATRIVLSDHGFAPYNRSFNLNTWLANNGYITLKAGRLIPMKHSPCGLESNAPTVGLNGLYLNLLGRERNGIVEPTQADHLMQEIKNKLWLSTTRTINKPSLHGLTVPVRLYQALMRSGWIC